MKWTDGKIRCCWANPRNERYIRYHDEEWGIPVHDDRKLFEMLILECFRRPVLGMCSDKRDAFAWLLTILIRRKSALTLRTSWKHCGVIPASYETA